MSYVKLRAGEHQYAEAYLQTNRGMVTVHIGPETHARMGFHLDMSPACARELAAALLALADAIESPPNLRKVWT